MRTLLNSRALTKIHSIIIATVIVVAATSGAAAYALWKASLPPPEAIKIGVCGDLDMPTGKDTLKGVTLAVEQINAEGGILGRNVTIIAEDDDSGTPPYDVAVATNALIKLITVDKADYIVASAGFSSMVMPYQDICSEHKKILLAHGASLDQFTQRVLDDYDKYKYYFSTQTNQTTITEGTLGDILTVSNYTGFTKVAILGADSTAWRTTASNLNKTLPSHGLEVVYTNFFPLATTDFTSYLAAVEASGAEILVPLISGPAGLSLVKEWYDRQSPVVIWGTLSAAADSDFWKLTEGKCDTVSFAGYPAASGYPLTNRTVPFREAYILRWGEVPTNYAVRAYDTSRFVLADAIRRAGTTETEAVIKALERTNIETTSARHFVFTSSHAVMVGLGTVNSPVEDYMVVCIFQWQNGTQVPVRPEAIMREAGATYMYPPWHGPWTK